jgi:hypothetical protein
MMSPDHYRKPALCGAPKCLLCALIQAHDKRFIYRAFFIKRTEKEKHTVYALLAMCLEKTHGKHKSLPCVFASAHGKIFFLLSSFP